MHFDDVIVGLETGQMTISFLNACLVMVSLISIVMAKGVLEALSPVR